MTIDFDQYIGIRVNEAMQNVFLSGFGEKQKYPPHLSHVIPRNSMLNPNFKYVHSSETDIRKTFKEERKRLQRIQQQVKE